jgi:hypothetical protein
VNKPAQSRSFEDDLCKFDKTAIRTFSSFEEAERVDREYWLSRTPVERMQALEHIRQLAWGYDDQSQPAFPRVVDSFPLGGS